MANSARQPCRQAGHRHSSLTRIASTSPAPIHDQASKQASEQAGREPTLTDDKIGPSALRQMDKTLRKLLEAPPRSMVVQIWSVVAGVPAICWLFVGPPAPTRLVLPLASCLPEHLSAEDGPGHAAAASFMFPSSPPPPP